MCDVFIACLYYSRFFRGPKQACIDINICESLLKDLKHIVRTLIFIYDHCNLEGLYVVLVPI